MPAKFSRWPTSDFKLGDVYVPLPDPILDELLEPSEENPRPRAKAWASTQMNQFVYQNHGFFIIDGRSYRDLDPEQRIHFTKHLAPCIGKPIVHHSKHLKQDLVSNIKDQGVRFTNSRNQNFNASNQEAVEHTESTELPRPIGAFLLHSVQPAYKGGANRFVNAYTLLENLAAINADYVDVLKRPFYFDTGRGERVESPIVSFDEHGNLDFRWMRAFLENGKPFTKHWNDNTQNVVDIVSDLMHQIRIKVTLNKGDIAVVNNKMVLHARDNFEDLPDHPSRWLLRSWFE